MKKTFSLFPAGMALAIFLAGCASQGPVVPAPPTVRVSELRSLSFTPDLVKLQAKILIHNAMPVAMDFERVDYAVDLFDKELFNDSFNGMKRTNGDGNQTVTFPFQIAMDDIAKQVVDVVSEESVRVTFRGEVYPAAKYGFDPIPFTDTMVIPIPKVPIVALVGIQGVPLTDSFEVTFSVRNTNTFAFSVDTVQTFLELNQSRYSLLHTEQSTEMQPGESGIVTLRMENTQGKALGMALNLAASPDKKFAVTGTIRCGTPYGWFIFPIRLEGRLK
jgi:xanthosine utilization system XapX-like protein